MTFVTRSFQVSLLCLPLFLIPAPAAPPVSYDPLQVTTQGLSDPNDFTFTDTARQREIPIRVYLPANKAPAPVILFSHGLGGSRTNNSFMGRHWSARGFVVVFMQHHGSDVTVWQDIPPAERMAALQKAAGLESFMQRVKDVPAVINQLDQWNKTDGHPLAGRLDLTRLGMSGHSFGAITTQSVSGQRIPLGNISFTDPRIKAALILSPSAPRAGDPQKAFDAVTIPWLLMTGTNDDSPIGNITPQSRLAVFPALPPGEKYELVLDGAEHSAFGEIRLPGDKLQRNPNHHRALLALSTAFWEAWLRDNTQARQWLDGPGPKSVLEEKDRWQIK